MQMQYLGLGLGPVPGRVVHGQWPLGLYLDPCLSRDLLHLYPYHVPVVTTLGNLYHHK